MSASRCSSSTGDMATALSSSGLEQDNETLRSKLRQLRDENSRLVSNNYSLVSETESVRYELHCTLLKLQNAEQQAANFKETLQELNSLRETITRERQTHEDDLKNFKSRLETSTKDVEHCQTVIQGLRSEMEECKKAKKRAECE